MTDVHGQVWGVNKGHLCSHGQSFEAVTFLTFLSVKQGSILDTIITVSTEEPKISKLALIGTDGLVIVARHFKHAKLKSVLPKIQPHGPMWEKGRPFLPTAKYTLLPQLMLGKLYAESTHRSTGPDNIRKVQC